MSEKKEIMVIDDEQIVCERLKEGLQGSDNNVEVFTKSDDAVQRLNEKRFDVVISDIKMSGTGGMDILRMVKEKDPTTEVIMITAYDVLEKIREAQARGVFEFVTKPFQMSEMRKMVNKAAKKAYKNRPSTKSK